jgi:hypothetical protein
LESSFQGAAALLLLGLSSTDILRSSGARNVEIMSGEQWRAECLAKIKRLPSPAGSAPAGERVGMNRNVVVRPRSDFLQGASTNIDCAMRKYLLLMSGPVNMDYKWNFIRFAILLPLSRQAGSRKARNARPSRSRRVEQHREDRSGTRCQIARSTAVPGGVDPCWEAFARGRQGDFAAIQYR